MCMIDGLDEPFKVWSQATRSARRPHRCIECGREIAPGERYEYSTGLLNSWDSFHTCEHCVAARIWLESVCHGFLYHAVQEDLEEHWTEHWRPIKNTYLGRLIVAMRNDWMYHGTRIPRERVERWAVRGAAIAMAKAV